MPRDPAGAPGAAVACQHSDAPSLADAPGCGQREGDKGGLG